MSVYRVVFLIHIVSIIGDFTVTVIHDIVHYLVPHGKLLHSILFEHVQKVIYK